MSFPLPNENGVYGKDAPDLDFNHNEADAQIYLLELEQGWICAFTARFRGRAGKSEPLHTQSTVYSSRAMAREAALQKAAAYFRHLAEFYPDKSTLAESFAEQILSYIPTEPDDDAVTARPSLTAHQEDLFSEAQS